MYLRNLKWFIFDLHLSQSKFNIRSRVFTSILPILLLVQYSPINIRRKGVFAHEKKMQKNKIQSFPHPRNPHRDTFPRREISFASRLEISSGGPQTSHPMKLPWHHGKGRYELFMREASKHTHTHRTCACIINTYRVRCSGGSGKMWQEAIMGSIEFLWFHIVGCFVFLYWAISVVFVDNVKLSIVYFVLFLEIFCNFWNCLKLDSHVYVIRSSATVRVRRACLRCVFFIVPICGVCVPFITYTADVHSFFLSSEIRPLSAAIAAVKRAVLNTSPSKYRTEAETFFSTQVKLCTCFRIIKSYEYE